MGKNQVDISAAVGYNDDGMNYGKILKSLIFLVGLSALIYFNDARWQSVFLGVCFLLVYFWWTSKKSTLILTERFAFSGHFSTKILAIFFVLIGWGWTAGAMTLFFPFTSLVLAVAFFANAMFFLFLSHKIAKPEAKPSDIYSDEPIAEESPGAKFGALVFLILVVYGFYLLSSSQTAGVIFSPWQTISHLYIWVFFLMTLILGWLIFSHLRVKTLLLFLFLQTFLLHSYLPLTHKLLYGADQWRHIGNEQRMVEGKGFKEAELAVSSGFVIPTEHQGEWRNPLNSEENGSLGLARDDNGQMTKIRSKIGRLSYGNFWAMAAAAARFFHFDLTTINKWLMPILWSVIFPLLLFELGLVLGWTKRNSLLFCWLGLLPFAWQVGGSFTLPVNFGFLIWLFLMLLVLKRIKLSKKEQLPALIFVGLGSLFGYALYFILFALGFAWAEVVLRMSFQGVPVNPTPSPSPYRGGNESEAAPVSPAPIRGGIKGGVLFVVTIITILIIPAVELFSGYSRWSAKLDWFGQLPQVLGNFSGYFLASGPRAHDIDAGNIIFNQTPDYAFVSNLFTQWRWWLVIFAVGFFAVFIYGLARAWRSREIAARWLATLGAGLLGGYVISIYFLSGAHLLARRLDAALALFLLVMFFYGISPLLAKEGKGVVAEVVGSKYPIINHCLIIVLSLAIAASYSLGPDTFTVSANQYQAVEHIWSQEQNNSTYCALGDTYPLLALEAVSGKEIIGGGFPIDANFAQPGRVMLYKQMNIAINDSLLKTTRALIKTDYCWFVGETINFAQQGILGGNRTKIFGDVAVVKYENLK